MPAQRRRITRCPLFHTSHRNKNPECKWSIRLVMSIKVFPLSPCNNCETWTTLMDTYQEAPCAQVPERHACFQCLCASRSHLWINTDIDSQKHPRICHNISTACNGAAEIAIKTNALVQKARWIRRRLAESVHLRLVFIPRVIILVIYWKWACVRAVTARALCPSLKTCTSLNYGEAWYT